MNKENSKLLGKLAKQPVSNKSNLIKFRTHNDREYN